MQLGLLVFSLLTPFVLLLTASILLLISFIKQKKLMRQQQDKLRELMDVIKHSERPVAARSYKDYLHEQLTFTQDRFTLLAPRGDIKAVQPPETPVNQRIVALRHAFLRAEELGVSAVQGSEGYWDIFRQALEPLLSLGTPDNAEELETYKTRVENLEKFKELFFDLEKRWNEAQAKAQGHYDELLAMAGGDFDPDNFRYVLGQYRDSYNDVTQYIYTTRSAATDQPLGENKTINIIRQDPRAAEEIIKLRNVAADQHRVINNLQRRLEEATTAEARELLIKDLEQQLQRQIRFVQECDTCVQVLEEELAKANEKISQLEELIDRESNLKEENQAMKNTLYSFTQESKGLLAEIETLEQENVQLRSALQDSEGDGNPEDSRHYQQELSQLRKQYAELEGKYLELKLK